MRARRRVRIHQRTRRGTEAFSQQSTADSFGAEQESSSRSQRPVQEQGKARFRVARFCSGQSLDWPFPAGEQREHRPKGRPLPKSEEWPTVHPAKGAGWRRVPKTKTAREGHPRGFFELSGPPALFGRRWRRWWLRSWYLRLHHRIY
jgi:hypothetical protein